MKTALLISGIGFFALGVLIGLMFGFSKGEYQARETQKDSICLPIPLPIGDTLIYRENTVYVIGGYALDVNNVPKENEQ